MRVQLHGLANNVRHLAELAVVHFPHRVENAALYRFESVVNVRNRTVLDEIGRIFQKVLVHQGLEVLHGYNTTLRAEVIPERVQG